MEIKILEGNVNYYKEANNIHVLAFGKIKESSLATVKIEIIGVSASSLSSTCGCTTTLSDRKNVFIITYKETSNIAPFSKVLILNYRTDNKNEQGQIKITGNIIK